MHDENKLLEQIDSAMDRQGLLEQEKPASEMDDLKLAEVISKAAVKIRKDYGLDLRRAFQLHKALMAVARQYLGLESASAMAATSRRMEKIFGEAVAEEEAAKG
jgi:hypothetical protein